MNNITSTSNELTMSSREIADLLEVRHDNVKRSMERMRGVIKLTPTEEVNHRGQKVNIYLVNKRDSYIVVAQLSPEFTAKLVDRWQELEQSVNKPLIPQTFSEALQLAANQARQLEEQAPKVAFVDSLVERDNLMNATQVARKHKKSAQWLNKILVNHDIYDKRVQRSKVFKQWFVDRGLGEVKQGETGHDQSLFTNAGEIYINNLLITNGYV